MSFKKTIILALTLVAALAFLAPSAGARLPDAHRVPPFVEVQLLALNDFHGNSSRPRARQAG